MKGMVRIGKVVPNPFTESGGDMKEWYHVKCIFEKLERARATTKKIEDITDLEGWEELQDAEKELINQHISGEKGVEGRLLRGGGGEDSGYYSCSLIQEFKVLFRHPSSEFIK